MKSYGTVHRVIKTNKKNAAFISSNLNGMDSIQTTIYKSFYLEQHLVIDRMKPTHPQSITHRGVSWLWHRTQRHFTGTFGASSAPKVLAQLNICDFCASTSAHNLKLI